MERRVSPQDAGPPPEDGDEAPVPLGRGEQPGAPGLNVRSFWYIACESRELGIRDVIGRTILDEDLVLFRDEGGQPVALRDRCMHRAAPLSKGSMARPGCLQCPYHGWVYDAQGEVIAVPCEKGAFEIESGTKRGGKARAALKHEVQEHDGLVFVRLRDADRPDDDGPSDIQPFRSPSYGKPGYKTVRLQNLFHNTVTNCAENFIDIPHTVFVHPAIFRDSRDQKFEADIVREGGEVHVTYRGETDNLGWFKWFLNPTGKEIEHTDHFFMPNVTSVSYHFGPRRHFLITSQSVPVTHHRTLVYTDLTFDYGIWNLFAGPIVRWQGQKVIDQDLDILELQGKSVDKYGDTFAHTSADTIHLFVESITAALAEGRDPRTLPKKERSITFWV
jgi:phenylpropionate dioxygenase-like ring-hydroxylating dioxygenase large terminal subunit